MNLKQPKRNILPSNHGVLMIFKAIISKQTLKFKQLYVKEAMI